MPESEPVRRLRAADITTGEGMIAAKIVGSAIEANRAAAIEESVTEAMEGFTGALKFVVLDFGEVDFVNSSAMATLLALAGAVKERGAEPVIYRPTDHVAGVLRVVKADHWYTVAVTVDELAAILDE
jgi:anti-anti-sigma factor